MSAHKYQQYKTAAVEQADPVRLVGLLYEGALRFSAQAQRAIAEGDAEGAHNAIMRCYAIVAELTATLDFEKGGEIAVQLEQLYDYVLHLLREANIGKDAALVLRADSVMRELAGAWEQAFRKGIPSPGEGTESNGASPGPPAALAGKATHVEPDASQSPAPESIGRPKHKSFDLEV